MLNVSRKKSQIRRESMIKSPSKHGSSNLLAKTGQDFFNTMTSGKFEVNVE